MCVCGVCLLGGGGGFRLRLSYAFTYGRPLTIYGHKPMEMFTYLCF